MGNGSFQYGGLRRPEVTFGFKIRNVNLLGRTISICKPKFFVLSQFVLQIKLLSVLNQADFTLEFNFCFRILI